MIRNEMTSFSTSAFTSTCASPDQGRDDELLNLNLDLSLNLPLRQSACELILYLDSTALYC
jgi:hypothetical protein